MVDLLNHKQLMAALLLALGQPAPRAKGVEMKKQILKALTMLVVIMTMALATAAASANAQTGNQRLSVNVPFDFIVGDKTMTTGQYSIGRITQDSDTGILVRSADSHQNAIRLTDSLQAENTPKQSVLVFRRYGNKFYLAQIWIAGRRDGRELAKSKSERAMERELAASQELASTVKRETVTIVAALQ